MEILILLLLIVLNGIFAMSEMAVVSSRKSRLQHLAEEGYAGARAALLLANNPSTFLSTIQVGITVIGITSGAFGEATIARDLAAWLSQWPLTAAYANGLALTIVVAGITVAALIIGELVPKRLALINPEGIASAIAKPMNWLSRLTYPLVRLLGWVTDRVLALFGLRGTNGTPVSEDEINVLMEQGTEAGVFQLHEQAIVSRVFRLDALKVTGVMTPRTEIVYLDLKEPLQDNLRRISESGHSRFPVVRGDLDHLQGIVQAKTLLEDVASGKPVDFAARLIKPLFVPETLTVMQVVETFKKQRQTIAFVVDEFGNMHGMVTLNDIMEALVGDIATVEDERDLDVVRRDDGSYLMDGSVTIERFKDVLDIDEDLPEEELGTYHTLGGFAMMQLERVPMVGDKFVWSAIELEVIDMDRHRVDKLLVKRLPAPRGEDDYMLD